MQSASSELALVLSGGGARSAYQAGFLEAVARRRADFDPQILTGVSAGGINAAFLANESADFATRAEGLVRLWEDIRTDDVFETRATSLLPTALRWGLRILTGRLGKALNVRGMVDTSPLRAFLGRQLENEAGTLTGIRRNLDEGRLTAVALTGLSYASGSSVTWVQGREIRDWTRAHRRSAQCELTIGHVLASASLPLFFPAERVGDEWFGDGGVRLTAPLAPAVHLGAQRILAVSIRSERSEAPPGPAPGYPPPAQVIGNLMNAVFLDQFEADALRLERINCLLQHMPPHARGNLRNVRLFIVRPSLDLGRLANECEAHLPGVLRFLTRGLGTGETRSNDLLSLLMFQRDYTQRLIELGRRDAAAHADDIDRFLDEPLAESAAAETCE